MTIYSEWAHSSVQSVSKLPILVDNKEIIIKNAFDDIQPEPTNNLASMMELLIDALPVDSIVSIDTVKPYVRK
jgi:hypothetical protein